MADVHSKEVRSHNMSRIRSKITKPELIVRKFLFANGFRYKLHIKSLPGKPDIVLKKYNTIIFINGCFWHKHKNCKYAFVPASNTNYWLPKLDKNVEKHAFAIKELRKVKWKVLVVWECDLKLNKQERTLQKILQYLKK